MTQTPLSNGSIASLEFERHRFPGDRRRERQRTVWVEREPYDRLAEIQPDISVFDADRHHQPALVMLIQLAVRIVVSRASEIGWLNSVGHFLFLRSLARSSRRASSPARRGGRRTNRPRADRR